MYIVHRDFNCVFIYTYFRTWIEIKGRVRISSPYGGVVFEIRIIRVAQPSVGPKFELEELVTKFAFVTNIIAQVKFVGVGRDGSKAGNVVRIISWLRRCRPEPLCSVMAWSTV